MFHIESPASQPGQQVAPASVVPLRIEEIVERIRRRITEQSATATGDHPAALDDSLPAIASRPELDYLNRHWALFDPLSEMRSHRRFLGPLVVRFRWRVRRLVLGVLDRYFEKERLFLLELVRFNNALAERSDRLLREVTERTKAVAERNDLFLGAMDVRLEALEAREQVKRLIEDSPRPPPIEASDDEEAVMAEMTTALGVGVDQRLRPFVDRLRLADRVLVLGCGDGESLAALDGVPATGVEASAELVRECRSRGFAAELASLQSHLEALPEGSLGGLVVTRVGDRHPTGLWPRLVAAAWRSLQPGGVVIFEGIPPGGTIVRLRWLLARQRFVILDDREVANACGEAEHVLAAGRGEAT